MPVIEKFKSIFRNITVTKEVNPHGLEFGQHFRKLIAILVFLLYLDFLL